MSKRVCFNNLYSSPVLSLFVILTLLFALLLLRRGSYKEKGILVRKCCGAHEMIGNDGKTCVEADWPKNSSYGRTKPSFIYPPLDKEWMGRWIPPGVPTHKVKSVSLKHINNDFTDLRVDVKASDVWNEHKSLDEDVWKNQVVFYEEHYIVRLKSGGGMREAMYCVDAAEPPLGPYVMFFRTLCSDEECVGKCCNDKQVMMNKEGKWKCNEDGQGNWWPFNSTIAKYIDREFPYQNFYLLDNDFERTFQHLAYEEHTVPRVGSAVQNFFFSSWVTCMDFYRNNSALEEGLFYRECPRVGRGIYRILRPLCVVSSFLLATTLLSIACNRGLRRKEYGCCLASHALCLFGFNLGQVVFYVAIDDTIIQSPKNFPSDLQNKCTHLALWMYFFLLAGWSWLTIICATIAMGFRFEAAASIKSGRKKFHLLSIIAWGIPALMTTACSFMFTPPDIMNKERTKPWYSPSLAETRVCFSEVFYSLYQTNGFKYFSQKGGTAVFYYGPVGCLVICNLVCLAISLKKVQRLRRGTFILRREEELRTRQQDKNMGSGEEASGRPGFGGGRGRSVDAKTIKLYMKLVLMTGALEITSEIIIWANTHFTHDNFFQFYDYHIPYRSAGYVTDFIRAVCVTWLAAPEGGYLGPLLRRLRGDKK